MPFKVGDKVVIKKSCTYAQLDEIFISYERAKNAKNKQGRIESFIAPQGNFKARIFVEFDKTPTSGELLWFHEHMLKRVCIWCDNTNEVSGKACPRCS